MKKAKILFALFSVLSCAAGVSAENAKISKEALDAFRFGAKIKETLHVVDSNGNPVSNATIRVGFEQGSTGKVKVFSGITDTNGNWTVEGSCSRFANYRIAKEGHYETYFEKRMFAADYAEVNKRVKDGRWEPWNPTVKIVLKEKREPVPLEYISGDFVFPCDTIVGFDFVKGDLVKPYGTGAHPDITVFYTATNPANRFSIAMTNQIRVAASANEGFLLRAKDTSSKLLSAYEAPEYGYEQSLVYGRKSDDKRILVRTSLKESDYLFFKTRVETNDQGRVVSARYGKIYRFEYSNANPREHPGYGRMRLGYYINPEANSRNLEWDGHDLRSGRKVDVDKVIGGF